MRKRFKHARTLSSCLKSRALNSITSVASTMFCVVYKENLDSERLTSVTVKTSFRNLSKNWAIKNERTSDSKHNRGQNS